MALGMILLCGWRNSPAQVFFESPPLEGRIITAIQITGNRVTRPEIILREMHTQTGSTADEDRLQLDLLRVKALGLFNHVEFHLTERADGVILLIAVTEEWYIFPLPFWDFKDNDPQKLIYGFRYRQNNFSGRNETLILSLWEGEDRGFRALHATPWVRGTPNFSRSLDFAQYSTSSRRLALKDLGLEERYASADIHFGKRWTIEGFTEIGARFRLIRGSHPLQLATSGGLDRVLDVRGAVVWDRRDLKIFPRRGFYLEGAVIQGWILDSSLDYQRLQADVRAYYPMSTRISMAGRLQWNPGWGSVPPYDWIVMSGSSPLRSSGLSDEGTSFWGAAWETRMDIWEVRSFTWKKAPIFREYFKNLEYGLSGEVFADFGDAYQSSRQVRWEAVQVGYGAGLLLILPYVDVVRLELCFNPDYSWNAGRFGIKTDISF